MNKAKIRFMVLFWGEIFARKAGERMVGSLLGKGNFEVLNFNEGHELLCAADDKSFSIFLEIPAVKEAKKYLKIQQIKIKKPKYSSKTLSEFQKYTDSISFMSEMFKIMLDKAFDQKCYGSILDPDCIFSENYITEIINAKNHEVDLLYTCALRQKEEEVLSELSKFCREKEKTKTFSVPPLEASHLFVKHLHPEIEIYNSKKYKTHSGDPFFIKKNFFGLKINTFFCLPSLIKYSKFPQNHLLCLKESAYENEYIFQNLNHATKIQKLEPLKACVLSLTSQEINWSPPSRKQRSLNIIKGYFDLKKNIKESIRLHCTEKKSNLRRKIFSDPFYFPKKLNLFDKLIKSFYLENFN
jgi:hypothetical protein